MKFLFVTSKLYDKIKLFVRRDKIVLLGYNRALRIVLRYDKALLLSS